MNMRMASEPRRFPLGELEEAIMSIIWKRGPATVREVHARLQSRHRCAYTTVMTVMGRLVGKRLLKRAVLPNGAFRYTASQPKERYAAATTRRIIDSLLDRFGDVAMAQFVDVIEDVDTVRLRKLQARLTKTSRLHKR